MSRRWPAALAAALAGAALLLRCASAPPPPPPAPAPEPAPEAAPAPAPAEPIPYVVKSAMTQLREGPSTKASVLARLGKGEKVTGVVMVEQVKSVDFRARDAKRIGPAPQALVEEVLSILDACIY